MPRLIAACLMITIALASAGAVGSVGKRPVQPTADHIEAAAQPAVAVVDAFSASLMALDTTKAGALLDEDVVVLESGGAEHSRAEYLAGHAGADAMFLQQANVRRVRRSASAAGDLAWVATESEVSTKRDGKAVTLRSTETMVLRRGAGGWKIVHIHWSSARKPAG